jgi:hypothetical protein
VARAVKIRSRLIGALMCGAVAVAAVAAPAGATAAAASSGSGNLVGTFKVTNGAPAASGAVPTGSYFRMVQPGGTVDAGPFVPNADSTATDKTYSLLAVGTGGGLATGKYQPQPTPAFDSKGNGLAATILSPTKFFGLAFAVSTNPTDPQTSQPTKTPKITVKNGKLSGDLSAFGVAYSNQNFNQGSPKPDGSKPTGTSGPSGTYDAKTGAYTLDWSSAIIGGPFDGFTGVWHLEGTFQKAKAS